MVRYAILGPVELCDGERRMGVGGPRQVALLALLLVNANRTVSSDRLIDALWGDLSRTGASKRLQVAITRLRRVIDRDGEQGEPVLQTVAGGYLLAVRPGELDAEVFEEHVQEGRRALQAGDAGRGREALGEALGLWRGSALAQVAYEEFAQPEIRRLEELRLAALEARVECELRLGEHDRVISELEGLVAAHPGRERMAAQLMLAMYRCGRQGDALEVYARTRAYLSGELGLEPGPALQSLQGETLAQSPDLALVDVGRHELRGLSRPERVYELRVTQGASAGGPGYFDAPVRLALPRPLDAPAGFAFVGRTAELESLCEHWTQVSGGERSGVVLGGEPGIGKTRLASEFARIVHERGALVLYGRCDEGLAAPYQPFVEALRPYARAVGPDRLRVNLRELAPDLGRLLPELLRLGEPTRGDPESERFALFEAITALIEVMGREQRALLILDDLHWAAAPTLLLVRHLLRSERPLGALVLCTYRETELEPGQPLAQLLADLHRDASAERMSICGLDQPAIAALLEAAVGHPLDQRDAQLAHALGAQTAGNPFFIRELLTHLAESGLMPPSSERPTRGITAAQLQAPEELRHVISHRIARLSAPARRIFPVAAVAGQMFSFALLERVLGERADILDALDEAAATGLLTEAAHGDYVFAHALVRQTIYRQLGAARRMRLHRQIGEALELLGDGDAHVEALAYHFAQAASDGQGVKAADYALAAGHNASARLGYEEAAAHYERGLEALALGGQSQHGRRCALLLGLGEAYWGANERDKARQSYQHAAGLADKLGDATALAHAALGFCGPHRGKVTVAVTRPIADLLQRALAALDENDSALRAQLMGRLGAVLADIGPEQGGAVLARQALELARRVADEATLADVLASALWAIRSPDSLHESIALARELGYVAEQIKDRRLRAMAHVLLLEHALELGDMEAVDGELEVLQRLAEARNERYLTWILAIVRARHVLLEGRLEDYDKLAHRGFAHRYEGDDEAALQIFEAQMLVLRRIQGRYDELVETFERIVAQYPTISVWRCGLASVYALLDRLAQARQQFEVLAHVDFEDLPRDATWLSNLSTLAEVAAFLGDVPRAQLLYKLLLPYADRCVVTSGVLCQGSASRALGLLATTQSRFEDATLHFEQAVTMNTRIRSPLWIASTQYDYAQMLHRRNHPGDNDKALELLTAALATAEQLGLKALADRTRTLKLTAKRLNLPRPTPRATPAR